MDVICAREPFPDRWAKSLFLAGPTPRDPLTPSWRPEALRLLGKLGYDGVVFVPEDRGMTGCAVDPENYESQIRWEDEGLRRCDAAVFWVPRDLAAMPAFTTNAEWGELFDSGKAVLGYPNDAKKMGYLRTKAGWNGVPVSHALEETLADALALIGDGAPRAGGETHVPIEVWRTPIFQRWHAAQRKAGNALLAAKVLWTYRIGRERERLLFWGLETEMHVASEGRIVKDGVVIGRPDIAATILLGPSRAYNTEVVLIREFRPSATTSDGSVHEPAGGSSWDDLTPVEVAAAEAIEEAGVALTTGRLKDLGDRQLLASLCPHRAHVFTARLTAQEIDRLRALSDRPLGRRREGECTWIEFHTIRGILDQIDGKAPSDVDWSVVGMILTAFYKLV